MEIRVLGELEVLDGGRRAGPADLGGSKPKQLLELLTAARGHPVSKDALIERLWPVGPPKHPVAALENHVWVLRRHLSDAAPGLGEVVVAEPRAYRLAIERLTIDLVRFDELVQHAHTGAPSETRTYLGRALALVRGELFEDEPYADWVAPLRETYRTRIAAVTLDLAEAALAEADASAAVELAGRVLDADPLSERACRLKMLGLAQQGERAHALQVFGSFSASLGADLHVEPAAETRSVYDAVRAGASLVPLSAGRRAPPPLGRASATRGVLAGPALEVPREGGRAGLVGRASELDELDGAIRRACGGRLALLLVEGLAHVGKSAVVRHAVARSTCAPRGWARLAVRLRGQPYLPLLAALRDAVGADAVPEPAAGRFRLERLSRELSRHAPVVLVLDDLHHADDHAVRVLANLQLRCADLPVVVVGILRAEEVAYDHPLRALDPTLHLRLGPLSAAQLDGFGGAAALARTGGYGAYLSAWTNGDRAGTPPDDLRAAVLGRCQAAGARTHRVLTVASVLSEPFGPEPIATVTDLRVLQVAELLDRAAVRGLLRVVGGGFAFSASLVSDVLRSQVSATRQELIRQVVAAPVDASEDRQVQAL
jgi:DNA-binding SARP family transcriptional activator